MRTNASPNLTKMFDSLHLYHHPKNIPKKRLSIILAAFQRFHGHVVSSLEDANVVLTTETGKDAFVGKDRVDLDWVGKCIEHGRMLEFTWKSEPPPTLKGSTEIGKVFAKADKGKRKQDSDTDSDLLAPSPKRKAQEFQCMSQHPLPQTSNNTLIISELTKLLDRYRATGDKWRINSYQKAISAIKRYDAPITSPTVLHSLPGIGKRTSEKIAEILTLGRLRKNDNEPEYVGVVKEFMEIYGVGAQIAKKWYDEGCRTLHDISLRTDLTAAQRIGLMYVDDFKEKIPREEITLIVEKIKDVLKVELGNVTVLVMGSYRRGALESSDIDLLVYTENETESDRGRESRSKEVMKDTINGKKNAFKMMCKAKQHLLHQISSILAFHSIISSTFSVSEENYRGVCRLSPQHRYRRLDILYCKKESLGAAIMHFTGNANFNRSLRLLADKKGMHLNHLGLFEKSGKRVAGEREEDIFRVLGVPYSPPEARNL